MADFKHIYTKRLLLKRLEESDALSVFEYRSMPEVYIYQGFRPETADDAVEFVRMRSDEPNIPGTRFQVAVYLRETGKLIGDIGLRFLEDGKQVEIGYTIHPLYHGNGYGKEAVRATIDYLFRDLKKHRVTASIDPDNYKSIRLCESLGMRKEAHFIKSLLINGSWADDIIYAVLEEEWIGDSRMKPNDPIEEYIFECPQQVQPLLMEMRKAISETAPDAVEKISYKMPTFYLNGNLVHFAAQSRHIGFYPAPSGIEAFMEELKDYKTSKGAIQFPYDKPLPIDLIKKIVRFRVVENMNKQK